MCSTPRSSSACASVWTAPTRWVDGRVTAGYQGAPVKFNQQIDERSDVALACQRIIVPALERNPTLHQRRAAQRHLSADVQPLQRGHEVRRACRRQRAASARTTGASSAPTSRRRCSSPTPRTMTAASCRSRTRYGRHSIKLAAGDMVVYPATSLHQVTPITRGVRTSCFFWVAEPDPRRPAARLALRDGRRYPAPQPDQCRRGGAPIADRLLSQSRAPMERDLMVDTTAGTFRTGRQPAPGLRALGAPDAWLVRPVGCAARPHDRLQRRVAQSSRDAQARIARRSSRSTPSSPCPIPRRRRRTRWLPGCRRR